MADIPSELQIDLDDLNLLEKRVAEIEKYLGIEDQD